uniref:Uncharacterized protein n=1 Tax=Zea mays TaxID=4577 RepID=A0A804U8L4_MAIZE
MMSTLYLHVSIISKALIFVTRSCGLCFTERSRFLLCVAFWAGVIWIYNAVTFMPMDMFKLAIRYALSGKAWGTLLEHKIAFTAKKDCMREEQEAQWAMVQRSLHGLQMLEETGDSRRPPRAHQLP